MTDVTRKLLFDALEAGHAIEEFVQNLTFSQYMADLRTRSAVERQFEILGEAFVRLRETDPEAYVQFPQAPRMIGFRNRLTHGYDTIDQEIVWDVIERHLPALDSPKLYKCILVTILILMAHDLNLRAQTMGVAVR